MARKAGMSDKAAKRNLTYLIDKLAVELISPENSATRTGRTYRIYSYISILQRRKDAEMLYVVRDKGVRFLTRSEVQEFREQQVDEEVLGMCATKTFTVDKTSTVDLPTTATMDEASTDTVDKTYPEAVDKTTTPLRKPLRTKERGTTTDVDLAQIVQALSQYGIADEAAARQIVLDTQVNCGNAQGEEIVVVINEKAPRIFRDRSIQIP